MEKYLNVQYIESIEVRPFRIYDYVRDYTFVPARTRKPTFLERIKDSNVKVINEPAYYKGNHGIFGNLTMSEVRDMISKDEITHGIYTESNLADGELSLPVFYQKDRVIIKMHSGEKHLKHFDDESDLREFLADKRIQGVLTLIS